VPNSTVRHFAPLVDTRVELALSGALLLRIAKPVIIREILVPVALLSDVAPEAALDLHAGVRVGLMHPSALVRDALPVPVAALRDGLLFSEMVLQIEMLMPVALCRKVVPDAVLVPLVSARAELLPTGVLHDIAVPVPAAAMLSIALLNDALLVPVVVVSDMALETVIAPHADAKVELMLADVLLDVEVPVVLLIPAVVANEVEFEAVFASGLNVRVNLLFFDVLPHVEIPVTGVLLSDVVPEAVLVPLADSRQ
ncbi:unnamed protein product, partial [Prorocentrum cordatum]